MSFYFQSTNLLKICAPPPFFSLTIILSDFTIFFFVLCSFFFAFPFCVQSSYHNHVIFTNHSFVSVPSGQLQNNWRKENKLKPRVSTRCPFISVISWDLLSFLLTAAHYRYACSVASESGAHALYCLSLVRMHCSVSVWCACTVLSEWYACSLVSVSGTHSLYCLSLVRMHCSVCVWCACTAVYACVVRTFVSVCEVRTLVSVCEVSTLMSLCMVRTLVSACETP